MSHFRLRIVKLTDLHGAGAEFPFAVQVSQDGLCWATIGRFKTDHQALATARDLSSFIRKNQIAKEGSVLWTEKLI